MNPGDSIGPYDLHEVVGRGGTGVVWRARHRQDDAEVALKLLSADSIGRERPPGADPNSDALLREVEAVARMAHPGIVEVYDLGRSAAGTPFIVMELLSGGHLGTQGPWTSWTGLAHSIRWLLDALAHAHARGVLHRDLKPKNVLLDDQGTWKLVDFGIASHASGGPATHAGTPPYMAPEQLLQRGWDEGPWTDLWALGCMTWQLVCGVGPFSGTLGEITQRTQAAALPAFRPRIPVPEGVRDWLGRLLEPSIDARFERAADAALALERLGTVLGAGDGVFVVEDGDTFAFDAVPGPEAHPPRRSIAPNPATVVPPFPADPGEAPGRDVGAGALGLGLMGLRPVPFVGRRDQRGALWHALGEVRRTGGPSSFRIDGLPGSGRHRLATWLAERADELGQATVLRALRGATLEDEAKRLLRVPDDPGPALQRLAPYLGIDPGSFRAQTGMAVLFPSLGTVGFAQRCRTLADWIGWEAGRRPVLLLIEETDAVGVGTALRTLTGRASVLVLVVAADEPIEATEAISLRAQSSELWLDDLSAADVRRLLDATLRLNGTPVLRSGNPGFLVELLTGWATSGRLEREGDGFRIAEATDPADVMKEELTSWSHPALQLGALLSAGPRQGEWGRACAAAGIEVSPGTLDAGVRAGHLIRDAGGWRFRSPRARRALVWQAAEQGHLIQWHAACAQAVRDPGRRGSHLLAAGDLEAAFEALTEAGALARNAGNGREATQAYRDAVGCLSTLGLGDSRQAADTRVWLGWSLYGEARLSEAQTVAESALAMARSQGWVGVQANALNLVAVVAHQKGQPALSLYAEAIRVSREAGIDTSAMELQALVLQTQRTQVDPARFEPWLARGGMTAALASLGLSWVHERAGHPELAVEAVGLAIQTAPTLWPTLHRNALTRLVDLYLVSGRAAAARRVLGECRRLLLDDAEISALRLDLREGLCLAFLGDLDGARTWLTSAARVARRLELTAQEAIAFRGLAAVHAFLAAPQAHDTAAAAARAIEDRLLGPWDGTPCLLALAADGWAAHGDHARSVEALQEGVAFARRLNHGPNERRLAQRLSLLTKQE